MMFNITEVLKQKINDRSDEILMKAEQKCKEARNLISLSASNNEPDLVFKGIELYIQAINIYPSISEPYLGIAYISWNLKNYDNAIKLLNKALEIDPMNSHTRNMLSEIKADSKNAKYASLSNKESERREKLLANTEKKPKQGLFSRVMALFSFDSKKTKKVKAIISKNKKQNTITEIDNNAGLDKKSFIDSVNKIQEEIMVYEKITIKINQNTLNQISSAFEEKKSYNTDGRQLPKANTSISLFDSDSENKAVQKVPNQIDKRELLNNISSDTKNKLTELRAKHNQEKIVIKVEQSRFLK